MFFAEVVPRNSKAAFLEAFLWAELMPEATHIGHAVWRIGPYKSSSLAIKQSADIRDCARAPAQQPMITQFPQVAQLGHRRLGRVGYFVLDDRSRILCFSGLSNSNTESCVRSSMK